MTFKIKFLSFMTKVNPNNGNETKSDISNLVFKVKQKTLKHFIDFPNRFFFNFMTKVNLNIRNQMGYYLSFFIGGKKLKYFSNFNNWHLSISLQK